jgi:hypothetical protein
MSETSRDCTSKIFRADSFKCPVRLMTMQGNLKRLKYVMRIPHDVVCQFNHWLLYTYKSESKMPFLTACRRYTTSNIAFRFLNNFRDEYWLQTVIVPFAGEAEHTERQIDHSSIYAQPSPAQLVTPQWLAIGVMVIQMHCLGARVYTWHIDRTLSPSSPWNYRYLKRLITAVNVINLMYVITQIIGLWWMSGTSIQFLLNNAAPKT